MRFYVLILDEGARVGIFNDAELALPYFESGMKVFEAKSFGEAEKYIRENLRFDQLFALGWEKEIDQLYVNHIHDAETARRFM